MKKYSRIVCALVCAVITAGTFSGCEDSDSDSDMKVLYEKLSDGKVTDEKGYVARTRMEATEESYAQAVTSGDWRSMKFTLNGSAMELDRTPYADLKAEGWSFDPAIYGLQDMSAKAGMVYERNIYVKKEGYDPDVFLIGITNFNEEPCGVEDIQLWSLEFIAKDKKNYPFVVLDGGVTWGADEETVRKAYDEPTETERHDETGSTVLKYKDDAGNGLTLELYDDNGLRRIVMENYS